MGALVLVMVTAIPSGSVSNTHEVEKHLRQACEIVWAAAPYQVERCTRRAMSAMSDDNRLRDNELKRMLTASDRELEECKVELHQATGGKAGAAKTVAVKREPK